LSRDDALMATLVACRCRRRTVRGAWPLLLLAAVSIATAEGCGSSSASQADGAVGVDATVDRADVAVPVFDCPELPCLGTAAGVIVPCKPDNTCTYQRTMTTGMSSETRCFTNGVTIKETAIGATTSNPGGEILLAFKKDGAACYSLEIDYADAARSELTFVYKDAAGTTMVTASGNTTSNDIAVTCPGAAAVLLPSGSCENAFAALGGLLPWSSCFSSTEGPCVF